MGQRRCRNACHGLQMELDLPCRAEAVFKTDLAGLIDPLYAMHFKFNART